MDYRGNSTAAINNSTGNGGALNDYLSGSISVITSPTGGRGSTRYVGQSSPSSVIEELQNRFQSTSRSREKRPILKNAPVNQDYSSPVYHRRTATAVSTSTTSLSSKPHHQSELMLPTTSSTEMIFEPPTRAINTASTVRMDPNGTMRAGGPSFRRLQTLYGTSNINQKRYPSDNALDMTYMEEKSQQPSSLMPQFYVSGRKAGTVKIAVRSRSEQTSPTNGPASPRQVFRVAAGGGGGTAYDDSVRSQQVILPQSAPQKNNTSSSVDGPQVGLFGQLFLL
ncbi:unnamed protein product [Hymenolepis diminuta]|uniref:Uncharacterized protein n=1 Tax=Hymenolepis diminuta TaxID=6216 RepID=A0A0R3SIF2_HYMDI|nr:unnamed protein product [Hymenolepis diminuta]